LFTLAPPVINCEEVVVGTGGRAADVTPETGTTVTFSVEPTEPVELRNGAAPEVTGTEMYSGGIEVSISEDHWGIGISIGIEQSGNCAEPATVTPIIPGIQEITGLTLSIGGTLKGVSVGGVDDDDFRVSVTVIVVGVHWHTAYAVAFGLEAE